MSAQPTPANLCATHRPPTHSVVKPASEPSGARVSLPTKENEQMVKKLTNLLRNKNPVTARQLVGFLRKTSDRRYCTNA